MQRNTVETQTEHQIPTETIHQSTDFPIHGPLIDIDPMNFAGKPTMLFAQTANNTKSITNEKVQENQQKNEEKPIENTETAKNPWSLSSLSFPSAKRKNLGPIEKIHENPTKNLSFLTDPQDDLLDIKPKTFLESLEREKPEEIAAFFEKDVEETQKKGIFIRKVMGFIGIL